MKILLRLTSYDELNAITDGPCEIEFDGELWLKVDDKLDEDKIVKYVQFYTGHDYKTAQIMTRLLLVFYRKRGYKFLYGSSITKYVASEISRNKCDKFILSCAKIDGIKYGLFLYE